MWTDFIFKSIDVLFNKSQNPKWLLKEGKEKITKEENIPYGEDRNEKFDYYYINNNVKKPLVIMIHGGGFVAGDKKYRTALSYLYIINKNINLININYKMSNVCYIDESIKSLVKALNFIIYDNERFNIDLNNIMITGDSSGAYFAAYLAELSVNDSLCKKLGINLDMKIKCAFLNCGAYSFKEFLKIKLLNVPQELLFRCTGKHNLNEYKYKDILNIEDIITKDFPKTLICDSKADFICGGQGLMLMEKFKELKVDYVKYYAENRKAGHVFQLNWGSSDSNNLNNVLFKFIDDNLK